MQTRLAVVAVACALAAVAVHGQPGVEVLPTPAGADSGMYSLTTAADGRTYLVWIEPAEGGHALKFAALAAAGWETPVEIARGGDWFVNWADHPSLTAGANGRLFVHWLINTGHKGGSYGYAIRVATSGDRGRSWTTAFEEGRGNVHDYSGFLSFLPTARGVDAVYLTPLAPDDGTSVAHDHIKTVGVASFDPDGVLLSRQIVDGDACSCCSTDLAEAAAGPVAVYRDHDAGEIRDISIVRKVDGKWTSPAPVHRDGWMIAGCPTNGPAVAASGTRVAVSWFTAAGNQPQVKVAFSNDGGATFAAPIRVDGGTPTGWADVLLLEDGRALVSWLERTGEGSGEIRLREVSPGGRRTHGAHRGDRLERPRHGHPDDGARWRSGDRRLAPGPRADRARGHSSRRGLASVGRLPGGGLMAFGRDWLKEWLLDPAGTYLNHGTVGATPRRVLEVQKAILDETERHPSRFVLRELTAHAPGLWRRPVPRLREAAAVVASFVGARADDVVFVDNATTGANAVLRSFPLEPGDEVLVTDLGYGGITRAAQFAARARGAAVTTVEMPYPFTAPGLVAACAAAAGPRTRLAVIDHVAADSAVVMPLAEIAAALRAKGVAVLADGAHAPGSVALDIPALGVDWYVANLHKWAWAPRSSGILWAPERRQAGLHPAVISWGLDEGFTHEFDLVGTRDASAHLAAPAALALLAEWGGDDIRRYNHHLATTGAQRLAERWGTTVTTPSALSGSMATVMLPAAAATTRHEAMALRDLLLFEHGIEVHVSTYRDRGHVRISAQIYNDMSDVDRLAVAVLQHAGNRVAAGAGLVGHTADAGH